MVNFKVLNFFYLNFLFIYFWFEWGERNSPKNNEGDSPEKHFIHQKGGYICQLSSSFREEFNESCFFPLNMARKVDQVCLV